MDNNKKLACDEMDRKVQQERQKMDTMMNQERGDMDRRLQLQRADTDLRLRQERARLDCELKNERDGMDQKKRLERATMDRMLKDEREEMDRLIKLERVQMDSYLMQARADMEPMLQQKHEDNGKQATTEHKAMENVMPMDIAPPPAGHHLGFNDEQPDIVMDFIIHYGGKITDNPKGYHDGMTAYKRFCEPARVEWWKLVEELEDCGYKGNTDLYYLDPGMEVPDGLVLISGPEEVDQLMQSHQETRKCHLYLHSYSSTSSDDEYSSDGQDKDHHDSFTPEQALVWDADAAGGRKNDLASGINPNIPLETKTKIKRKRDSFDSYEIEEGPSQQTKQYDIEHHKVLRVMQTAQTDGVNDDKTVLDPQSIDIVQTRATVSRAQAVKALQKHNNDIDNAVKDLTEIMD